MIAMKKIYMPLLLLILSVTTTNAQVNVDGIISLGEGYTLITTGDLNGGWQGVNAKKIYFTQDATKYYFAAEFTGSSWMAYGFIMNTTANAGGTNNGWSRKITYNHTEKPDIEVMGNCDNTWAEIHTWNGTAWAGTGTNIGASAASTVTGNMADGAVEVAILKSQVGTFSNMDVQFFVTGNNNDHGCFDAIPNDNVSTGWTPPASATTISNYASVATTLSISLADFTGNLNNNTAVLNWKSLNTDNIEKFEIQSSVNGAEWNTINTVLAKKNQINYSISTPQTEDKMLYRIKILNKNNSISYSSIIMFKKTNTPVLQLLENPVRNTIRLNYSSPVKANLELNLFSLEGKKVAAGKNMHNSGTSVITLTLPNLAPGVYFLNVNNGVEVNTLKVAIQ